MKQVSAIVLAAGQGIRFKSKVPKPLVEINSKPLVIYSLYALSRNPRVKEIIVVANPLNIQAIKARIRQYGIGKVKKIVIGGKKRQDSVLNGLRVVAESSGFVLIHDAARPFIGKDIVSRVIKQAQINGAAIAGVPVKATIKEVHSSKSTANSNNAVKKTLNRNNLWEIQTPQVFRKDLIMGAFRKFGNTEVTDDASLVEKTGAKVKVVMGSYSNIKVTTPEDLILAKAISCHSG